MDQIPEHTNLHTILNLETEEISVVVYALSLVSTIFITAKMQGQPRYKWTGKWLKKTLHMYTMEYYLTIWKNKIPMTCSKVHRLEDAVLSETSQTQKDKYYVFSRMWRQILKINLKVKSQLLSLGPGARME